ncbi:hypothetical protein ACFWP0_14295 [Achromobacter sp. NPDC058515]|uniref:hypothetical protein n=1 Tax=Achromobacter sp. NPDC058515 TaxID=3346533 RepID=UPI0036646E25
MSLAYGTSDYYRSLYSAPDARKRIQPLAGNGFLKIARAPDWRPMASRAPLPAARVSIIAHIPLPDVAPPASADARDTFLFAICTHAREGAGDPLFVS